ncbi:MAG: hypothetical protein ABI183_20105 [Polyangiaceae bacterium]
MKSEFFLPSLLAVAIALVSTNAAAGPNSSDVDEMFSIFALEGRGFIGTTASLDSPGVAGGDAHILIEAPSFAVLFGGRFGGDFKDSQIALADLGVAQKTYESRLQPTPVFAVLSLNLGFFLGGEETKREHHHDKDVRTEPEEVPLQP